MAVEAPALGVTVDMGGSVPTGCDGQDRTHGPDGSGQGAR
jgi:hypothetical protein